jgi:N-acetylglutamate synthase-like GNAT family acetyltransferase
MLTSLDPVVLRARAWDHGRRPIASAGLRRLSLGGVAAMAVNGMVFVAEEDAAEAEGPALAAGMTDAGTAPLMTFPLDVALAAEPSAGVERACDPAAVEELCELIGSAFGLSGSAMLRSDLPEVPGADGWLLREEGRAIAGVVTTPDPDLVGLWSMATPPGNQRKGYAARLLRAVLAHYALEGATNAYVIATPAGEQLYGSLGFQSAERLRVWQPR